jgi:hypothetical protein
MRAISLLPALLLFAACSETTSVRNNREEEDNTLSDTGAADTGGSGAADTGGSGADTTPVDTTPPAANTPCTVETVATDCSGGYGCDGTICYVECRDELDCQEGSTCLVPEGARYGACQPGETGPVPGETDYAYVAIVTPAPTSTPSRSAAMAQRSPSLRLFRASAAAPTSAPKTPRSTSRASPAP